MILISLYYYLSGLTLFLFCWLDFRHRSQKGIGMKKVIYLYNFPPDMAKRMTSSIGEVIDTYQDGTITVRFPARIPTGFGDTMKVNVVMRRSSKSFKEVL